MRLLLFILLFSGTANAGNNYYVSKAGSDLNDGSQSFPVLTISKAINLSSEFDTINLRANDVWTERGLITKSNLNFRTYSTGAKASVTGFLTATGGTADGNIYTYSVPNSVASLNTVLINGKLAIKARYPNSNYLTATTTTDSTLTISASDTANCVGKQIIVRSSHWILDKVTIMSKTGLVVTVSPKLTYDPDAFGANGWFKQNDVSFLDNPNEFVYDSAGKILKVYATSTPTVEYSTSDTLVWVRNKTSITVDSISFSGANVTVFQLDTCSRITIKNSTLNNNGTNGITFKGTTNSYVLNDSILNTLNNAILTTKNNSAPYVTDVSRSLTITGNYFKNTAIYAGMGLSNNNQYFCINISADSSNISNNTIDSSGYIPLQWNGRVSTIKNNYITNYCFVKDDGGGIYTVAGDPIYYARVGGSIVRGNIILNGLSATAGTFVSAFNGGSAGIYLDDFTDSVTVDSNTVYSTTAYAFNLRTAKNITAKYNTFIDSLANVYNFTGSSAQATNYDFKHNIYYQKKASNYISVTGSLSGYSYTSDSNYFLKPIDSTSTLRYNSVNYTLSGYQAATTYEDNSHALPLLANGEQGVLFTNPSSAAVTFNISRSYVDVYGTVYFGEFTLPPYTSLLLFPTTISFSKTYIIH